MYFCVLPCFLQLILYILANTFYLMNCRYSLPDEKLEMEEAADKEPAKLGKVELLSLTIIFFTWHT